MFRFLTLFWLWDSCRWIMHKYDDFVWWAFLNSVRFLLTHPVAILSLVKPRCMSSLSTLYEECWSTVHNFHPSLPPQPQFHMHIYIYTIYMRQACLWPPFAFKLFARWRQVTQAQAQALCLVRSLVNSVKVCLVYWYNEPRWITENDEFEDWGH